MSCLRLSCLRFTLKIERVEGESGAQKSPRTIVHYQVGCESDFRHIAPVLVRWNMAGPTEQARARAVQWFLKQGWAATPETNTFELLVPLPISESQIAERTAGVLSQFWLGSKLPRILEAANRDYASSSAQSFQSSTPS